MSVLVTSEFFGYCSKAACESEGELYTRGSMYDTGHRCEDYLFLHVCEENGLEMMRHLLVNWIDWRDGWMVTSRDAIDS